MRISPVGIEPPRLPLLRRNHEKVVFSVKDFKLQVQKANPYGFTKINLSVSSAEVETKKFTVRMLEVSVEKTSVSIWRKAMNDYELGDFMSKEFDWMAGYVSRNAGIDEKKALELFKDVLKEVSKGIGISEKYIASALRRLNPSLDPKKAMKLAEDIKIFLESMLSLLRLHKNSEDKGNLVEILKMSLRRYTFTEEIVRKKLESLA